MTPEKIHFTKEKETMLMTLNGRALQSQWKNPILRDPWAEEAMRHIDYDISKQYRGVGSWSMWNKIGCTIIATRAATFDLLTNRYLADHPEERAAMGRRARAWVMANAVRDALAERYLVAMRTLLKGS